MKMWIGRNEDGTLALFKTKPMCFYEEGGGHYWAGHALYLPRNEYPEVPSRTHRWKLNLNL